MVVGCIGVSIAKNLGSTEVIFADISEEALDIAKINSDRLLGKENNLKFIKSDMFENIEEEVDIIVSNPPYIETGVIGTLDKQVQNEPFIALDGGDDGLKFYRTLVENSYKYLSDDGYLLMEIGYSQKDSVIRLVEESGYYKNIYSKKDLAGNDRVIVAQRG